MRLGHERESVIADMVSRHLGSRMQETGSWPHPDYPFLFASPDRLMIDRYGEFGLLECKSMGRLAKLSDKFLLQVQMQLACVSRARYAYIAMYDGKDCVLQRIQRDAELIRDILPYLKDVHDAARPVLEGTVDPETVFADDVRTFGRMEQNDVRALLGDTRRDFVGDPVIIQNGAAKMVTI